MSAAKAILNILHNGETIRTQTIEGEVSVGRGEGCVIRLDDRAISRQHAVFKTTKEGIQVQKKSEFAPLKVNGAECTQALVKEGDVISIGPYLLKLQIEAKVPIQVIASPTAMPIEPIEQKLNAVEGSDSQPSSGELNLAIPSELGESESKAQVMSFDSPSEEPAGTQDSGGAIELSFEGQAQSENQDFASPMEIDTSSALPVDGDGQTKVASSALLDARIIIPPGLANVTEFVVGKEEVSIGRGKDCSIVLNDKKSSRKHALLRRAGLGFIIKDLDSANGIYVNGVKVQEQELADEDLIRIGEVEMTFRALSTEYLQQESQLPAVVEEDDASLNSDAGHALPGGEMSGMEGIPGISGANTNPAIANPLGTSGKRPTLMERFRALPKKRQYIWIGIITGLMYFLLFVGEEDTAKDKGKNPQPKVSASPGVTSFDTLSAENKKLVEGWYTLGFEHYKNREYDKSIFEIRKISALLPDGYKNSKDIERYAIEGKRQLDVLKEEQRKKEEEAARKAQIAEWIDQGRVFMQKRQFSEALPIMDKIVQVDPENAQVSAWKGEIRAYEEAQQLELRRKELIANVNKMAWERFNEGLALKKDGKLHAAIDVFSSVRDIEATDKKPEAKAKAMIEACKSEIDSKREPFLQEGKQAEEAGEMKKAYDLYEKATRVDPPHPDGYAGMQRIRGVLRDRAKVLYTEAVLAESFSDFELAKQKFKEAMQTSPEDDVYFEKAKRKLERYFRREDVLQ